MANIAYITAGLPVAKDSGQSPASGVNTAYLSAGIPPDVDVEAGNAMPMATNYYRQHQQRMLL